MVFIGRGALWGLLLVVCLNICFSSGSSGRYIAGENFRYKANFSNGSTCLTFSLEASIVVSYRFVNTSDNSSNPTVSVKEEEFELPNNTETSVVAYCPDSDGSTRLLRLSWLQNDERFNITFNFTVEPEQWYLAQVLFDFELDDNNFKSPWPDNVGHQSYQTSDHTRLFNRTFGRDQYFHCKSCKKLWLRSRQDGSEVNSTNPGPCFHKDNKTVVCSFMQLSNSVLYVGDLDSDTIKKKLCLEDFIELQEIIIPSVVGGILGLLLLLVFTAYLIAFLRRKKKEGRYETLNDGY